MTRFKEIAFLNAGLKIVLIDKIKDKKEEFFAAGGLMEFVKWLNRTRDILHKPIYIRWFDFHLNISIKHHELGSGFFDIINGILNSDNFFSIFIRN